MCANKRASLQDKNPLDDLFSGQPAPKTTPPTSKETSISQTTILLTEEQLLWLDEKCLEARRGGDKSISKTGIIRALIELARQAGLNLEGVNGEQEIVDRIREAIRDK